MTAAEETRFGVYHGSQLTPAQRAEANAVLPKTKYPLSPQETGLFYLFEDEKPVAALWYTPPNTVEAIGSRPGSKRFAKLGDHTEAEILLRHFVEFVEQKTGTRTVNTTTLRRSGARFLKDHLTKRYGVETFVHEKGHEFDATPLLQIPLVGTPHWKQVQHP